MSSFSWVTGNSGDWSMSANWTGGVVPSGSTSTVSFGGGGSTAYTSTIGSSDDFSLASLAVNDADANLSIDGSLTLNGGFDLSAGAIGGSGTLTLTGGTIEADLGTSLSVATLVVGSSGTVILDSNLADGGGLTVSAGKLQLGANSASVAGAFEQDAGTTLDGSGTLTAKGTALFTNTGTAAAIVAQIGTGTTVLRGATTVSGNLTFALESGRVLENQGTVSWTGGTFQLGGNPDAAPVGGGQIQNDAGGTFAIESDGAITFTTGTASFINHGSLTKSVTSGTTTIAVPFINDGTVSVQSGTLELDDGGSSSAGAFTVAPGATLALGGTKRRFSLAAGTLSGTLELLRGNLQLNGGNVTIAGAFEQRNYSILDGTGTLTLTGATSFINNQAGPMGHVGTGTTRLQGTTAVEGDFTLDGDRVLDNQNVLTWSSGVLYLGYDPNLAKSLGGGTILNDAGATFAIQSDSSINNVSGKTGFNNAGKLTKSVTTGTTKIFAPFVNTGTISVQTGSLELDGTGNSFGGTIGGGAKLTIAGSSTVANLLINGGVTVTNTNAVDETAPVTIGDGASAASFVNAKTGTYSIGGDSGIGIGTAAGSVFSNAGTLIKSAGTKTSLISVKMVDTGTIQVASGTLAFNGNGSSFAGGIAGAGTLAFTGGNQALNANVHLTVAHLSLSGHDALAVNTSLTYAGTVNLVTGASLTVAHGDTLTLAGNSGLAGALTANTLILSGANQSLNTGVGLTVTHLSLVSGDGLTVNTSLVYSGTFGQAAGTTLKLATGRTLTLAGMATLAGALTGAGTLGLAGGSQSVAGAASLGVANLSMSNGDVLTIDANLTYSGVFHQASGTTLTVNNGDTLSFTGNATLAGLVTGDTLALAGGSQTLDDGISLGILNLSMSGGDSVTADTSLAYSGSFTQGAGTSLTVASGDTLTLMGEAMLAGALTADTLMLSGGSQSLTGAVSLAVGSLSMAGTDMLMVDANLTFAGTLSQAARTTLSVAAGDTLTLTGAATLAGAVSGAGTLVLNGSSQSLAGGASLGIANLSLSGSDTLTINKSLAYSGVLTQAAGTTLTIANHDTLTLTANASFAGFVTGQALALGGGSQSLQSGASLGVLSLSLSKNDTLNVDTTLTYFGAFNLGAGAKLAVASGDTLTFKGNTALSGTVSGAVVLDGNLTLKTSVTLGKGRLVNNKTLQLTASGGIDGAGSVLNNTGTIVRDGTTPPSGTILSDGIRPAHGRGVINIDSDISNTGTVKVLTFSLELDGDFINGAGGTISVAAGAELDIYGGGSGKAGAFSIASGAKVEFSNAAFSLAAGTIGVSGSTTSVADGTLTLNAKGSQVIVAGTFALSGTSTVNGAGTLTLKGQSAFNGNGSIDVALSNGKSLSVAKGAVLDLAAAVSGAGTITDDGKLEIGASFAASQRIALMSDGSIDLNAFASSGAKASFKQNSKTQGVLTITAGAQHASLTLFGQYVAAGFSLASDGGNGTAITYTPPPAPGLELAAGH